MKSATPLLLLALTMLALSHPVAAGDEQETLPKTRPTSTSRMPGGIEIEAKSIQQTDDGQVVLEGAPTLRWRESRFQADRIVIRQERFIEAEGNVLVVWGGNRISGSRMTYDLEEDRGTIEDAIGRIEPEFYFQADRVEKTGEDRVFLDSATITTCTQPVPYWSFSVSSARVRINHYARMWNLRLKARKVPTFYLPYMVWPVKKDRSAGLLFPKFGSTRDRGQVISQGLFIPLGDSADVTLVGEYYTVAGFGGGGEVRFIPNRNGAGTFNGFYIQDQVTGTDRWRATFRETQRFLNGFRMVADINQVSDFQFFSDYERDIRLVSSPTILARVEFARNGKWSSVNVRELRREQFVGGGTLVQQTLPELEWRGRSTRLGKSPFYLSYESSVTSIQQVGSTIDADYVRGDVYPTLSVPVSPFPWLDVTPQFSYRWTWYSQRKDPTSGSIVDKSLVRGAAGAGLEIVGPKFFRIFERKTSGKAKKYKHSFEPRVAYSFRESFDRSDEVIRFDEVDLIPARNLLSYGIRSRLFTKRPRSDLAAPPGSGESIVMPDGEASVAPAETGESSDPEEFPFSKATGSGPAEPVEIATLDITQSRALDDAVVLSTADLDRDGVNEATSQSSSVQVSGRFNPNPLLSFDVRGRYHALYKKIESVSLSGNIRRRMFRLGFSAIHRNGLGVKQVCLDPDTTSLSDCENLGFEDIDDDNQLRLNTGLRLFGGKLVLDLNGSYNSNPAPGRTSFPDRRLRVEYYTQCCGFLGEYLARDFVASTRREFRFTVDLRGIGKFLDLHHGADR